MVWNLKQFKNSFLGKHTVLLNRDSDKYSCFLTFEFCRHNFYGKYNLGRSVRTLALALQSVSPSLSLSFLLSLSLSLYLSLSLFFSILPNCSVKSKNELFLFEEKEKLRSGEEIKEKQRITSPRLLSSRGWAGRRTTNESERDFSPGGHSQHFYFHHSVSMRMSSSLQLQMLGTILILSTFAPLKIIVLKVLLIDT